MRCNSYELEKMLLTEVVFHGLFIAPRVFLFFLGKFITTMFAILLKLDTF